ncbi:hypothetical protein CL656_04555 [bacterium]|nr:hypothetical protein [bacterium]|tara:strand:+ start:3417 stop:4922 length:1506 start_codon:yes stop_codon:yes gene_type:complete
MSKLNKIIDQASTEIANLSHPNTQKLQEQLSQIQESITDQITQDLINKTNLLIDDIQEAKLQYQEELNLEKNIIEAKQKLINIIARETSVNGRLKLDTTLNSILENIDQPESFQQLIDLIENDRFKAYRTLQKSLIKQLSKYKKTLSRKSTFDPLTHTVEFSKSNLELESFIEPVFSRTKISSKKSSLDTANHTIQESSLRAINENILELENPTKPESKASNWIGLSALLLGITGYMYNLNSHKDSQTTENQFPAHVTEHQNLSQKTSTMEYGIYSPQPDTKIDLLNAREFLISLTNETSSHYIDFDITEYCNYSRIKIENISRSILIKSEENGDINSNACVIEPTTKSTYIMPVDEAFNSLDLKRFNLYEMSVINPENKINLTHKNLELNNLTTIKNSIFDIIKQEKRVIAIKNLDANIVQALVNIKSIQEILNYPEVINHLASTGLIENNRIYCANLPYEESNYVTLKGIPTDKDSILILTFFESSKDPNSLIIEFSNN